MERRVEEKWVHVILTDASKKVKLITVSSQLLCWQEFSFNILAWVSVKINLAPSHLSSDHGESGVGWRGWGWDEKNWSGEVGHAVLG